ncbi:MAG: ExsB family protein, partial [Pseudothermotoga sp.]
PTENRLQEIIDSIVSEIRTVVREKLVIAFSGGEDSTLVAVLAKMALGDQRVELVTVDWGPFTYENARFGVTKVAEELGLRHTFIDGRRRQSEVWRHGPSCNMCTRYAKLDLILSMQGNFVVATGSNLSDSWGRNGVKMNDRVYSPLMNLDKKTIRLLIDYLGVKPMKIGESAQREGCKLKHLLKMMINPSYHGGAVDWSNEVLLRFLREIDYKHTTANVKIIGPLSKNIALVNVLPHLNDSQSSELIRRLKDVETVEEIHILKTPVKLKILVNPSLYNDSTARMSV